MARDRVAGGRAGWWAGRAAARTPNSRVIAAVVAAVGLAAVGLAAQAPAVAGAEPTVVGQATQVVRSVYGTVEDVRQPLVVDGDVFWQELIETGDESASRIVFVDETSLSTGPNSRVRIDQFVYPGGPGGGTAPGRVVIELTQGVLRFVSGLQPSAAYTVRTPNAMIGVRGTDFVVLVDESRRTRVFVRRGEISLAGIAGGRVVVRAGSGGRVGAAGSPSPADVRPPEAEEEAAATQITALLAIAGEAAPDAASEPADVGALSGRKGQAAAIRAATSAGSRGPGCGGC